MAINVGLLKISKTKTTPPLLLLPAFPFNLDFWLPVVERLNTTTYIANPPGFSDSSEQISRGEYKSIALKDAAPRLEDYAIAVLTLLQEYQEECFIVSGCSMGGYTALAMLAENPAAIAGLCLLDTNAQADSPEVKATRLKMAESCRRNGKVPEGFLNSNKMLLSPANQNRSEMVKFIEEQVKLADTEALAWAQEAMAHRSARIETLRAVKAIPAVVARGAEDDKSSPTQCQEMAAALGIDPLNIAGAGHLLPLEKPHKIAALLTKLAQS